MKAQPLRSHKNIGARWLRTRGWTPPVVAGGNNSGQEDHLNPNMETFNGVDISATNVGNDLGNQTTYSMEIREFQVVNGVSINPMINGDSLQSKSHGKEVISDQCDSLTVNDSKKRKVGEEGIRGHVEMGQGVSGIPKNLSLAGLGNGARPQI
uniref:Uncharacterized protein n=1 Tax=Cannabis sativa TaxID=3483 RepID=A0A803PII8_CANSA